MFDFKLLLNACQRFHQLTKNAAFEDEDIINTEFPISPYQQLLQDKGDQYSNEDLTAINKAARLAYIGGKEASKSIAIIYWTIVKIGKKLQIMSPVQRIEKGLHKYDEDKRFSVDFSKLEHLL